MVKKFRRMFERFELHWVFGDYCMYWDQHPWWISCLEFQILVYGWTCLYINMKMTKTLLPKSLHDLGSMWCSYRSRFVSLWLWSFLMDNLMNPSSYEDFLFIKKKLFRVFFTAQQSHACTYRVCSWFDTHQSRGSRDIHLVSNPLILNYRH